MAVSNISKTVCFALAAFGCFSSHKAALTDLAVGKAAVQDIGLSERRILTGLLLLKSSRS